jgi:hypothetical protein
MKILIIADVHEQIELVEKLRKAVPHDELWSTGDWFDDYGGSNERLRLTLEFIKSNPEIKGVLGNHDVPYFFGGQSEDFYCPGYTRDRGFLARRTLGPDFKVPFQLHAWIDGWLISHAGVHPYLLRGASDPEEYKWIIDYACTDALRALHKGQRHFMTGWGEDRGGDEQRIGGITWLDWNSFQAIPGLNQIVGHTYKFNEVRKKEISGKSINYCLDTGFRHFALIEDGKLEIFQTEDFIGRWKRNKVA